MESKCIAGVYLSGKKDKAQRIAIKAGEKLMKSVIKVEGMGNFVVLEDANTAEAAKMAARSICKFSGQDCYAPHSYLVMGSVYE